MNRKTTNTIKHLNDTLKYYLAPYQVETYLNEVKLNNQIDFQITFLSNGNHQITINKNGRELFHGYLNKLIFHTKDLFNALEGCNSQNGGVKNA